MVLSSSDKNMEANAFTTCRVSEIMEINGCKVHNLSYLLIFLHSICLKLIENEPLVDFPPSRRHIICLKS